MLLDSCDVDIFESAYNNVGLCSDTLWMLNDSDSYQRTNQDLWINYNRVKKRYNELDPQDSLSKSNVKQVRTVRDVIPLSNLAKYGNYEYDEDRESLYATDDSVPVFEECDNSSSAQEPWMLPEVEQEFKRLTNVSSYEHKLWNPGTSPPNCVARRVASEGRLWASGRWWQLESWAALLLLHYPELAHTLRDTHQSSLFSDQGHGEIRHTKYFTTGTWRRTPAEPRDFTLFPPPRFSVTSPEELALQLRINSAEVRNLWAVPTKSTPSPLNRRQPPPPLNADVPEFFPKAAPTPSAPSIHISPISPPRGGPRPLYFPSALDSPEELFPYREQATSTVSVPRTIPVYQRPPEFYTHQLEAVSGGRKQGGGVDYNNLIFLTSQIQGQRRARAQQQGLLEWLQSAYPDRHVDMSGMDALTEELATYEGRLLVVETPSSSTSAGPLKRRLYRDVLANATPSSPVPLLPPPPGLDTIPPAVASTSSSNSLEKRFDELERLALEQYRSSEESISQCFQDLERQALEQYQCCSSSSSSGSSEGDPKQCGGGSKHCVPSGGPPRCAKRTQSQHELPAAVAKPRPVAASKSQCAIVPGVGPMVVPAVAAAAARPSAGRGGGDRSTAPGTAARRRLVLVPSEKRPPPTLDTSDSEDGGGPRLLVVAPTSRQPCRLVASVLDCGDSPAVAAAEVVMAHSPEANPNERRTQVSAEPRIQSANTVKDDPPGVPETWVQPATEPPEPDPEPEPEPEPGESLESKYTRSRSAPSINRCKRSRRRRRQQPLMRAAGRCMATPAEELEFYTRVVRRVGLLPYDFAIDVSYDQGLIRFLADALLDKHLRTRVRRRHASWPEDADPAAPWPDEEVPASRDTIYHVTARGLRRRAGMCLRRVLAYALPSTPQGVFLIEVQITDVRHLLTITVVEESPPPDKLSYKKEVVTTMSRVVDTITNQLWTKNIDSQQVLETQSNHDEDYDSSLVDSDNSDLCVDDFLCAFKWGNLLPNGNGFVSSVRDILNDEKGMATQIAKEAENKLAQSSSRMFQILSRTKSNSSCNNVFRDPTQMNEEESHVSRTMLPIAATNIFKQNVRPINHQMPDLINEVHKPEHQNNNIGYSITPEVANNVMDGNYNSGDLVDERINDKRTTMYSANVLIPQVVCKNVKDAVKQFLVTKTHYLHDLRVKTQNQIRNSHRKSNSTSILSPQKMGKSVVDAVKQVLLSKNPGSQDLRHKTRRNVRVDYDSDNVDLVSVSNANNSVEDLNMIPSSSKVQDKDINCENIIPPYSQIENTKNCYNRVMTFSSFKEVGSISGDNIIPTTPPIESINNNYGKVRSPSFQIANNNNNDDNSPISSSPLANINSNHIKENNLQLSFSTENNGNICAKVNPFSSSSECKKRVHTKVRSFRHKGQSPKNAEMIASFLPFETGQICNDNKPLLTSNIQVNGYNHPKSYISPQTESPLFSQIESNSSVCEKNITSPLEIENESKPEEVTTSSFRIENTNSDPIKTTLETSEIGNKTNEFMEPDQLLSPTESPNSVLETVITTTETTSNDVSCPITTESKPITSDVGDGAPLEVDMPTKILDTDASSSLPVDCNNYNALNTTSSLIENDNSSYKVAILTTVPIDSDSSSYITSVSPSSQIESDSSSCYDTVSSSPQTEMNNNVSDATFTTIEQFQNIDEIDLEVLTDNSNKTVIGEEENDSRTPETLTNNNCSIPDSDTSLQEAKLECLSTSSTISETNNTEGKSVESFEKEIEDGITMSNKSINICLFTESKSRRDKEHKLALITSLKARILKRREKNNITNNKSRGTSDILGEMNVVKQDVLNGMNLDKFYISDTEDVTTIDDPLVLKSDPEVPGPTAVDTTSCCGNNLERCNIAEFCLRTSTEMYKTSDTVPKKPACVVQ